MRDDVPRRFVRAGRREPGKPLCRSARRSERSCGAPRAPSRELHRVGYHGVAEACHADFGRFLKPAPASRSTRKGAVPRPVYVVLEERRRSADPVIRRSRTSSVIIKEELKWTTTITNLPRVRNLHYSWLVRTAEETGWSKTKAGSAAASSSIAP